METDDALPLDLHDHPRPARATRLVAQRMADQPVIQRQLAAIEPCQDVLAGEQLRPCIGHRTRSPRAPRSWTKAWPFVAAVLEERKQVSEARTKQRRRP